MSRRREKQRDHKRELARQLGVDAAEVDADLLSHARVTEPEIGASLALRSMRRGFFARPSPLVVDVALYIADTTGVRLGARFRFEGAPTKSGPVALSDVTAGAREKVRYTRPGSFVVVATLAEGDDARIANEGVVADVDATVAAAVRAKEETPRAVATRAELSDVLVAAGIAVIPAAHRVQTSIDVPLLSARVDATLALTLRL